MPNGPNIKFNRPLKPEQKNRQKLARMKKQQRKRNRGPKKIVIPDAELTTKSIIKKRKTNPTANISLSGKKKRKILNQLRRLQNEKNSMEVEIMKKPTKKNKSKSSTQNLETMETD